MLPHFKTNEPPKARAQLDLLAAARSLTEECPRPRRSTIFSETSLVLAQTLLAAWPKETQTSMWKRKRRNSWAYSPLSPKGMTFKACTLIWIIKQIKLFKASKKRKSISLMTKRDNSETWINWTTWANICKKTTSLPVIPWQRHRGSKITHKEKCKSSSPAIVKIWMNLSNKSARWNKWSVRVRINKDQWRIRTGSYRRHFNKVATTISTKIRARLMRSNRKMINLTFFTRTLRRQPTRDHRTSTNSTKRVKELTIKPSRLNKSLRTLKLRDILHKPNEKI